MDSSIVLKYGATQSVSSTNTAASLPSDILVNADGDQSVCVYITCESQAIRYAYGGTTPTQGASGVGHELAAASSLRIVGYDNAASFKYLSKTNGSHALLQITGEY